MHGAELRGGKDKKNLKARVIHSGFPFAFLARGSNLPFFPPLKKDVGGTFKLLHTQPGLAKTGR